MLEWIDYSILLLFMAYSLWVGFRLKSQASHSSTEYFLAGRKLKGWQAGLSMAATQFAADTPLLVTGLMVTGGLFSSWRLWIYGLAFLMLGFLISGAWRRAGVLTDAELTLVRYSGKGQNTLRALKAIYYGTFINCAVMAMVLIAATRVFEIFLPWHLWLPESFYHSLSVWVDSTGVSIASGLSGLTQGVATTNNLISITLLLLFTTLYTTSGGLGGVVKTDVLQFTIMILGTLFYAYFAVDAAGGLTQLSDNVIAHYGPEKGAQMLSLWPTMDEMLLPFLVILSLQWFFQVNSDGTGYLAQRTMACRSDQDARIASIVFTFSQVVIRSLVWLPIVIALLIIYPFDPDTPVTENFIAARETLFVQGIGDLLPVGVKGLMVTALFAALASTIDSHLNWGVSYWANDLYKGLWVEQRKKKKVDPRKMILVARVSSLLILSIALLIMINLNSVQSAWQISLLFGAGTGSVLVLRWFWEKVNIYSELVSITLSILLAPLLLIFVEADWLRLAIMSGVSLSAVIFVSIFAPQTEESKRVAFYQQVKPFGWWRQTAVAAGDNPNTSIRGFQENLFALCAGAVSVYGFLIAGTLWMLQGAGYQILLSSSFALIAIPFWWKILFQPDQALDSTETTELKAVSS
ncbi:sodium:solute symporter family transporter [Algicola sagamiensis]|uniref:sodium:solute symporter family transporter n=1 Tax=Algicola sagamiensis TaxID=163869 RepID=UPI00035C2A26|nr:hypothetical protein [Algicola sagamiensis]